MTSSAPEIGFIPSDGSRRGEIFSIFYYLLFISSRWRIKYLFLTIIVLIIDYEITDNIVPRFFKNKLKGATYTSEMEHIYFAQHALNPNSNQTLQKMTPKEYRARYIEIMRKVDRSPNFRPDPDKYRFKAREAREERKFGIFSALE